MFRMLCDRSIENKSSDKAEKLKKKKKGKLGTKWHMMMGMSQSAVVVSFIPHAFLTSHLLFPFFARFAGFYNFLRFFLLNLLPIELSRLDIKQI